MRDFFYFCACQRHIPLLLNVWVLLSSSSLSSSAAIKFSFGPEVFRISQPVNIENAVEMVDLVLKNTRRSSPPGAA